MINFIIAPDKVLLFFCSSQKHMVVYSLEVLQLVASNEYPQRMFFCGEIRKILFLPVIILYTYIYVIILMLDSRDYLFVGKTVAPHWN